MSRYKVLLIPVTLLAVILTSLMFVKFKMDWKEYFEQLYLDTVVNYCTDAAIQEMLDVSGSIASDYFENEYVQCNPQVALDSFCDMFCENLGYSLTEENKSLIQNEYIKGFAVAAYDGLYLAEPTKMNDGSMQLVFQPKKAYMYNDYYINLTNASCATWDATAAAVKPQLSSLPDAVVRRTINAFISDEFTGSVFRNTEGQAQTALFLPGDMTSIVRTNPITSITVLAYVSGVQVNSINPVDSFALGGSRLVHEEFVAGYIRDGIKYYVETSKLKGDEGTVKVFINRVEAARAGYQYDISRFE